MLTRALLLTAAIALPMAPACAQDAADAAQARVSAYGRAISAVAAEGPRLGFSGRESRFLPIVKDYYDLPGALATIAGPAWAGASTTDKAAAIEAFGRNSAIQHAQNFAASGLTFTIDGAKASGEDVRVRAKVGGEPLIYRLRQSGGRWKIYDVTARGVSQLALQTSGFAGAVASGGVKGLTAALDSLNAKAK